MGSTLNVSFISPLKQVISIEETQDTLHLQLTVVDWDVFESNLLLIVNSWKRQLCVYYDDDGQGWLGRCTLPKSRIDDIRKYETTLCKRETTLKFNV